MNPSLDHIWLPYTQMKTCLPPLIAEATAGSVIRLKDGKDLIDGIASWWTACHGYNHPHILQAMESQLRRMPHVMFGGLIHEPAQRLAARLAALTPGDLSHVFFSDSGSVAVEAAMKMAVQYRINKGDCGHFRFVSFRYGYHGDTAACMSVCDPNEGMHAHFKGYLPEQIVADIPRDDASRAAFAELIKKNKNAVAAVIVEPLVQGAGGMKFHSAQNLRFIADCCRDNDILLIADEIFTGFGRTGTMFACAQADVVPDILCLGKALTGGAISLAATIARAHVFEAFLSDDPLAALMHGPTYMANPLACAAANASLDLFETEPRLSQVAQIETRLKEGLESCKKIPGVKDVRVKGAIGVVQCETLQDPAGLRQAFAKRGLWIRPFGDIVYLTPAFTIDPDRLDALTDGIRSVLPEWLAAERQNG